MKILVFEEINGMENKWVVLLIVLVSHFGMSATVALYGSEAINAGIFI